MLQFFPGRLRLDLQLHRIPHPNPDLSQLPIQGVHNHLLACLYGHERRIDSPVDHSMRPKRLIGPGIPADILHVRRNVPELKRLCIDLDGVFLEVLDYIVPARDAADQFRPYPMEFSPFFLCVLKRKNAPRIRGLYNREMYWCSRYLLPERPPG
jgi:hypothetical protein